MDNWEQHDRVRHIWHFYNLGMSDEEMADAMRMKGY